jgi:predicted transport protein
MTSAPKIEKFFCNVCKGKTNHFIRAEHTKNDEDERGPPSYTQKVLIIECCGCEYLALVKKTNFSEDIDYDYHPVSGEQILTAKWDEVIYPPVTYRVSPAWFEDLPDPTLRDISNEIYKSLQTGSHYLATFGSRTLIDRLIVLTVGDKGNFTKGLAALRDEGKISQHERDILEPVLQAGHAAAHRGWAPTKEQLAIILDTVEGLIHRLLVLPKLAEELEEAVPGRGPGAKVKAVQAISNVKAKIDAAPKDLRAIYDELATRLKSLGSDVTIHPQKHYMAFRRNRNFASVQIYNQKKVVRVYLNLDPDTAESNGVSIRDVRQIGHFGTGDLEVTIKTKRDIEAAAELLKASYEAS